MKGFWNSKSEEDIKKTLRVNDLVFIGKFKKIYDTLSLFNNLRNVDYSPVLNLKSNIDERNFVKCEVLNRSNVSFIENTYYKISVKIIPLNKRTAHSNEFLLEFDNECQYEVYIPNEKEFTNIIYDNHINANNANSIGVLKAVKTITYQINKKNETFIYELLQNADDYPSENEKVEVDFFITDKYLLFTHTGSRFNFNNVYSLCAVNAEDKTDDFDKIGFKGIGFKSVFKANDYVYVNSGTYSFRFEKSFHNAEYPWQLMPIWTEKNDLELSLKNNNRFLNSNVAIALKPRDTINTLNEYSESLELFTDDRILLFLKNIDKVNVFLNNEKKIFCRKNNKKWWLRHFDVEVDEKITKFLNTQINEGNEEIPSKFNNLKRCKISFASIIEDNKIKELSDAKLFNYLPLSVNLNLPFLINADFIPDGEREGLINNDWNKFLLETSGIKFVQFIRETLKYKKRDDNFKYSIFNLIPSFKINAESLRNNEKWNNYFNSFKLGFESAILGSEAIAFIPNKNGKLEVLSNILIDDTGLAVILEQDFYELTGIDKSLIDNKFEDDGIKNIKTLIKDYEIGTIYSINELKTDLKKPNFQEWLKVPENNFKIIQHFHTNEKLQGLLETEAIILTANNELNIASEIYKTVPDVVTFVEYKKINEELLNLLIENKIALNLKEFDPIAFYKEKIWSKNVSINEKLHNEVDLLNFWDFIYDYWSEFEKEEFVKSSLKLFNVLCKSLNEETLYKKIISAVYIANDFNPENEIESVILEIGINNAKFISEKYISKQRIASKWYKIFKQALAITDLQKVIEVLLPNLSTIEESKHFEIAKQIFKFWKENQNKESRLSEIQLNFIRENLKLKGINDEFYNISEAIISDHYNINNTINSILPIIELPNQISSEYGPRANQIVDWKNFFKILNCIELSERQNVIDVKTTFFIENQESLRDYHFDMIMGLSELYKTKNENGLEFSDIISEIKLLTDKDDNWCLPSEIHLSSLYRPKLDLQKEALLNESINFLNEKYIPTEIDKFFILSLGVNSSFKVKKSEIRRDKIPLEYLDIFEKKDSYITSNAVSYGSQHRITNHITINYPFLLTNLKYSILFWQELIKDNSKFLNYIFEISNYKMAFNKVVFNENYLLYFIKTNQTIPNQNEELKKPEDLFSFTLANYVTNKSEIAKYDFSKIYLNNNEDSKSLERILGIKDHLSHEHCIEFLIRKENRISLEEIIVLKITDILKDFIPSEKDKENIFLLNQIDEWKPLNELFYTTEEEFEIDPSNQLNDLFMPIAKSIGVQELSEDDYTLIVSPTENTEVEDIKAFFKSNALFFGFKISESNYLELETEIVNKIRQYNFFQVMEITKGFPESNPIYKKEVDFFIDTENNVYYKDFWKSNKDLIDFLFCDILESKVTKNWLNRVITGWSIKEIIEDLKVNSSIDIPNIIIERIKEDNIDNPSKKELDEVLDQDTFWSNLTTNDIEFIKGIILGDYELNEKLDANKTAKIKTLMKIRDKYNSSELSDGDRFLIAGSNEILVRSAQNGLLYLDLFHWERLNETNVQLAIYTNNQINIYDSQENLIKFTKPQNKFGILRLPVDYSFEDYNSLENIYNKGEWHYVFIVNENTKAAQNYKEFINLDDYNF